MGGMSSRPPRKRVLKRIGRVPRLQAVAEHLRAEQLRAEQWRPGQVGSAGAFPNPYTPPTTTIRQLSTARLLPARYSDSVLLRIADSASDLDQIYALDNATNERLIAEANGRLGIGARELVFDIPFARIINAAFAHPHPQGARFSTPSRGAWYAAWELATAKAEVMFHRSVQFSEIGWLQGEDLDYDHYAADFAGVFHDLRPPLRQVGLPSEKNEQARRQCLDPGSYVHSQQLASELLEMGSLGIIFPSTRRPGGTCLACLRPALIANVRKRGLHRLSWRPDTPPTFARVAREGEAPTLQTLTDDPEP